MDRFGNYEASDLINQDRERREEARRRGMADPTQSMGASLGAEQIEDQQVPPSAAVPPASAPVEPQMSQAGQAPAAGQWDAETEQKYLEWRKGEISRRNDLISDLNQCLEFVGNEADTPEEQARVARYKSAINNSQFRWLDREGMQLVANDIYDMYDAKNKGRSWLRKGWDQLQTSATSLAAGFDTMFNPENAAQNADTMDYMRKQNPRAVAGIEDIHSLGDFFTWGIEAAGEQAPNLALAAAGGVAGGAVAGAVGATGAAATLTEMGVAGLAAYPMNFEENAERQVKIARETGGKYNAGAAHASAIAYSAIDSLGAIWGAGRQARQISQAMTAGMTRKVATDFAARKMAREAFNTSWKAFAKDLALDAASEGGQEVVQDLIGAAFQKKQSGHWRELNEDGTEQSVPEYLMSLANEAVAAGFTSLLFGGAGGAASTASNRAQVRHAQGRIGALSRAAQQTGEDIAGGKVELPDPTMAEELTNFMRNESDFKKLDPFDQLMVYRRLVAETQIGAARQRDLSETGSVNGPRSEAWQKTIDECNAILSENEAAQNVINAYQSLFEFDTSGEIRKAAEDSSPASNAFFSTTDLAWSTENGVKVCTDTKTGMRILDLQTKDGKHLYQFQTPRGSRIPLDRNTFDNLNDALSAVRRYTKAANVIDSRKAALRQFTQNLAAQLGLDTVQDVVVFDGIQDKGLDDKVRNAMLRQGQTNPRGFYLSPEEGRTFVEPGVTGNKIYINIAGNKSVFGVMETLLHENEHKAFRKKFADLTGLSSDEIKRLEDPATKARLFAWNDKLLKYDADKSDANPFLKIYNGAVSGKITQEEALALTKDLSRHNVATVEDIRKLAHEYTDELAEERLVSNMAYLSVAERSLGQRLMRGIRALRDQLGLGDPTAKEMRQFIDDLVGVDETALAAGENAEATPAPAPATETTPKAEPPKKETPKTGTPKTETPKAESTPAPKAPAEAAKDTPVPASAPETKAPAATKTETASAPETSPATETAPAADEPAPAEESAKTPAEWLSEKGIKIRKASFDAASNQRVPSQDRETVEGVLSRRIMPQIAPALSPATRKSLIEKLKGMGFRVTDKSTDATLLDNLLEKYTDETGKPAATESKPATEEKPQAPTPKAERKETPAAGEKPATASDTFSVITPDGEMTVEGKWEAVPSDKIVTSFDPRYKQFEKHMQNRITTGKTNEQKVEKYANGPLYRMAGNSEISDTGAAFGVWHDGLCYIVAGNHHTRGIQLSFERGKGGQFEADARADMERRGVKVPDGNFIPIRIIDGMTREQLVEFADKSNQRATQEHRDGEKAVKDVPIIKKHISKLHANAELTSRDNIDFVEALLKEFKDESLRNSDLTPNDKAYRRVRLALVASVLSATDEDAATTLAQVFAEKAESLGLQNIIDGVTMAAAPVLSATEAAKGTDLDFGRNLAEALRAIVDFKQNGGKSMKAFLAQEGFDFGDKQALSEEGKLLAQTIAENANAPQKISAFLTDVATRVEKAVGEADQEVLFASEEAPSLEKIIRASAEAISGKASEAEVNALRSRAPALFDALWKDKDGTADALAEVERQINHVRDAKDKTSALRAFTGNAEARKQAGKYWNAEHPTGESKLGSGPVTTKPEAPATNETQSEPAEAPTAQPQAPAKTENAEKPATRPRAPRPAQKATAPAPVTETPVAPQAQAPAPQAPVAPQGGEEIAGVQLSADDVKAFTDLGNDIMMHFSRGDVDADTVNNGNRFVALAVERGVKDFRTFATLAKRFIYGNAEGERRAGAQNFLAARWTQYLMDEPDSGIEEITPSRMRAVFAEIDNERPVPAPAPAPETQTQAETENAPAQTPAPTPTQETTTETPQNQEQKNEAPSTNETREEASERPDVEPEANPVERTEAQPESKEPVKEEAKTQKRAPATAQHTVVGKSLAQSIASAPTTRGARLAANIEAIRIAKDLDATGREATEEEREKLAKFTGWGGLGGVFNDYDERTRLQDVLTPDELSAAELSANSAYFTPQNVTDALWNIARALGFKGGRMLEGSAGVGNIISAIPEDMRAGTDVRAVEIDPITSLILKGLHPKIEVDNAGFQDVNIPAGSVQLAITNVPFVTGLRVYDKNNKDLSERFKDLHDFCIAKNIRALAEGGIGIFITTSNTLDKSDSLRRWITSEGNADVIGAFRLPNNTFGGTAVTSDIIVVRKRVGGEKSAAAIDISAAPVERTGEYGDKTAAMYLNKYFHDHPEMMGGEMAFNYEKDETFRPTSYGLFPSPSIDAAARLADFVKGMEAKRSDTTRQDEKEAERERHTFKLEDEAIHEGELHVAPNGEVAIARGGESVQLDMKSMKNKVAGANGKGKYTRAAVVKDYTEVKATLHTLLDAQKDASKTDTDIEPLLKKLNSAYDWFVKKYGPLNLNNRISWLDRDIFWPELCALEEVVQDTNSSNAGYVATTFNAKDGIYTHFRKSDVFNKRVIAVEKAQKPSNVTDAILLDYRNTAKVSAENVAKMLGISTEEATAQMLESGLAFIDPATSALTIRHDYLSGNVREKLAIAQAQNEDGKYDANIKALNEVMPPTIPAHLIGYALGSTWLPMQAYTKFFYDRFDVNIRAQNIGGRWVIDLPPFATGKNFEQGVYSAATGKRISGAEIAAAAMRGQSTIPVTRTYEVNGRRETEHDRTAEATISTKIDEIRDDFKSYVQKMAREDADFAAEVESIYNERFNNLAKRVIDDRFLPDHFPGANPAVTLYPHQKRAVILGTTQPVMLAHEVGSGKTFTLITTAMEMRRLGTARKPMVVVQNATIGQFVASAKFLYPAARILAPSKSDTGEAGRKEFFAKAKFNDWDMVIVPQSMFGMIPDSEDSQTEYIKEKLEEKREILEALSESTDVDAKRDIAQKEKEIADLMEQFMKVGMGKASKDAKNQALADEKVKERAKRLLDRKVDEVETFQDMDIDAILIDEAHNYKKLGFETTLTGQNSRVKGIDTTASKKAVSTYMKIRHILASQGGRNVVMATGTPISNTAAEIFTFMRYLMPLEMRKQYGIEYFDDFVHNFGDISQLLEFNTSGKFKESTRFAGYFNTAELVRLWQTISDTVLAKDTAVSKALPEIEGGEARDVFLPQTPTLIGTMKGIRDLLVAYENMSGREKKQNSHIPLVAFGLAKAAAIDVRLLDPTAKDEQGSKTNKAVDIVLEDLEATKERNGTVAVFCDRNKHQTNGTVDFNLFDDMKQKLVARGVPANQIAIIESGLSDAKKVDIFDKINAGEIRVVFGSTETLGTGVNIQKRLHLAIHMDAPPRPMDYTQRNGRILRQGNLWKQWGSPVRVVRFGVEDSLDVSAYQRLKTKSEFINSVMNLSAKDQFDALSSRSIEDSEEEGVFDNPVATLSGSQYALLKNKAERDLRKLNARRESYEADQVYLKKELDSIPGAIKYHENNIADKRAELQRIRDAGFTEQGAQAIEFDGQKFDTADEDGITKQLSEDFNKQLAATRKEAQGVTLGADFHKVLNLPVKVDGVDFTVRAIVESKKEFGDNGLPFMRSTTTIGWVCPELGKRSLVQSKGQWPISAINAIVQYTKGVDLNSDIDYAEKTIERLRAQQESIRSRYGVPFAEEAALKEAEARIADYEQKMKAELAEKEKKYAEAQAAEGVNIGAAMEAEQDEETGDTGMRLSRGDEDMDAEGYFGNERYEAFRLDDNVKSDIRFSRPDITVNPSGMTRAKAFVALASLAHRNLENLATGIKAQINAVQRNKILSNRAVAKSEANGFSAEEHNAAASIIGELWKYASMTENRGDRAGDANIASIKRFVAPLSLGDKPATAHLLVKESVEKGHRIYSLELDKLEASNGTTPSDASMSAQMGETPLSHAADNTLEKLGGETKSPDSSDGNSITQSAGNVNANPETDTRLSRGDVSPAEDADIDEGDGVGIRFSRLEDGDEKARLEKAFAGKDGTEYVLDFLAHGDGRWGTKQWREYIKTIDWSKAGDYIRTYRAMEQLSDGTLIPPMAGYLSKNVANVNGAARVGDIVKSDERPDLIIQSGRDKGKFPLFKYGVKKDKGKYVVDWSRVPAAYNPYLHSSFRPLNDQFALAWARPNLVTVEMLIPTSEFAKELPYHADQAHNAVGLHPWTSGPVTGQLHNFSKPLRQVLMSQYGKINRVLSNDEVAASIMNDFGEVADKLEVPQDVFPPEVYRLLTEKYGVKGIPMEDAEERAAALGKAYAGQSSVRLSRGDSSRFEVTPEEAAAIRALDIHGGKNYLVGASQVARFYTQHEYEPAHLTKEKVWEESFGIDAPALVAEIVKKPRVLTPYEHAAMVRHLASYEARLDALTRRQNELEKTAGTPTETLTTLDNEIAVLGGAIKTIYAAFDYAGTKAGQALAFRNLIQNAEMTAGWMLRRMKKQMDDFHVVGMPAGFIDNLERFALDYKRIQQELEAAKGDLSQRDAEAAQMNEILHNLRNRPKKDPGTRLATIMTQTQDLVDAQGELSDYQIEKLVKKIATEYVALDPRFRNVDALLGEVREFLSDCDIELDDAQVREYFAGRTNIYDRNEARKLANRLQKQVAKAVALEEALQNGDVREMRRVCRKLGIAIHEGQAIIDAQNAAILAMLDEEIAELEAQLGEKPEGPRMSAGERSTPMDIPDSGKARLERLRALRAEIANADADETRTARIREYDRSRLASEQARLQNIIGKTREEEAAVPPAATPELEDAERELRDAEREEREARRRGEQNTANQEQKRIQRLREKVAALEKQVLDAQDGFFMNDMPKMKKRRAMTAEESALVQRIAELRHAYRTLLDAQFPGEQSAEERAIRARQRAIQRSIDHLQNKMEGSEQAQVKPAKDYSNDPRLDGLKQQLRDKKREYLEWEAAQKWNSMSVGGKAMKTVADFFDLTKSLVASGDLSAIWTQCGWMMLGNPRLNVRAVRDGLRALFSGKQSEEIMNKLARDYDLARFVEDGLQIHAVGTAAESEMFARDSNPLLNKLLPQDNKIRKLSGMWLEASARGFDTPINIIRATTYAAALDACQKNGKMLGAEERQTLAQLINYATGTGDMKFFKQGVFRRLLWAPSRISGQIQTIQNMVNLGLSSISDKLATKKFKNFDLDVRRTMFWQVYGRSLANYILLSGALYALSRLMWDDDDDDKRLVGKEFFNPLSAQFLKYNLGGNYFAPLGGMEIYLRTAARTVAGGRTDRYGRFKEFDGYQNGSTTDELMTTFMMNKLSPTMQLAVAALNREAKFETLETPGQILQYVVQNTVYPLTLHDSVEAMTENGIPTGAALTFMNLVGLSSWSYGHVKRDTAVRSLNASLKAYNEFAKAGDTEKLRALMNRYDWLKPQYRVRLTNLAGQYRKIAGQNKKAIAAGRANANMMARQAQLAEQIYAIMHEAEGQ